MTDLEIDLERALATLAPALPAFTPKDVRAALLLARQRQKTRIWQAVAAILLVALATLAFVRPAPRTLEREKIAYLPAGKTAQPVRPAAPHSALDPYPSQTPEGFAYLHMRQTILTFGIDALRPNRPLASAPAAPLAWGAAHTDELWPRFMQLPNTAPTLPKLIETPSPETKL